MSLVNGLIILLLGVLGCACFAKGADKELQACPDWPTGPRYCSNVDKANNTCQLNSDCSGKQKCCRDGCQSHCTDSVPAHLGGKACPADLPSGDECPPELDYLCRTDAECPSNKKCCREYCELVCIVAVQGIVVEGKKPIIRGNSYVRTNQWTGGKLKLTCSAQGGNQPQISWYKNWVPLKGHKTKKSPNAKKIGSQLIIPNAQCRDGGKYQCVVKTTSKHALKEFHVRMYNRQFGIPC